MVTWTETALTGWGRTTRHSAPACAPTDDAEAAAALADCAAESLLAHGGGRSYGDAALNGAGRILLTRRMNRVQAFDPESGRLVCEPGVTFRQLLDDYLPRGYLFPVSPGTAFTTIGGAVANDVHGKNHDKAGSFGNHLLWVDLLLPSGECRRVTPEDDPELFRATVGGIGLTGLMLRICFRMQRVPSAHMEVRERRMTDLDAFMSAFEDCRKTASYTVGWIDALARGRQMGRGILETAEFAPRSPAPHRSRQPRDFPLDLPSAALNALTVRLFNALYYRRIPAAGRDRAAPVGRFFYPLDAIGRWNRIYGRRGFYQFQCVIPNKHAWAGIPALLETVSAAGRGSFLAVLKTLGGSSRGHLSFPLYGYTLALDFPRRHGVEELLQKLENITRDHGGRLYLAKDALLSPEGFREMYPSLASFRAVLERVDPERRFESDMARRLRIRDD